MEVRELTDEDDEVLGAEYCSGYTDIYGKWNTGFYCPSLGNGETVYCCGTVTSKYCCTRRDQQTSNGLSQSVILGSALGSVLVFVVVSLVSCLVCRRCLPYRRAHPSLSGGPLYSMQCSSTASGVANMYSFSGQNSLVTTPHEIINDSHHVLMDMDGSRNTSNTSTPHRPFAPHRGFGMLPSDPPPPYNDTEVDTRVSYECRLPRDPSAHTTTSFTAHSPTSHIQNHSMHRPAPQLAPYEYLQPEMSPGSTILSTPETLLWSTKF